MTWLALWVVVAVFGFVVLWVGFCSYDLDWCIAVGGICVLTGIGGLVGIAINAADTNHDRLMKQCMAAGLPEYECVSKLKQDVVPVMVPMVIR